MLLGLGVEPNPRDKVVVMLRVPREVLMERMENKDRANHFAKSNLVESQLATLELPSEETKDNEEWLKVVDGTKSVKEIVDEIIRKIQI